MRCLIQASLVLWVMLPAAAGAQSIPVARTPRTGTLEPMALPMQAPPPTAVFAQPLSSSLVQVSWTCPAGASGYQVLIAPAGGASLRADVGPHCVLQEPPPIDPAQLAAILQARAEGRAPPLPEGDRTAEAQLRASFDHSAATPGVEYGYVVRALYPDGRAGDSEVARAFVPHPAPTGLVGKPVVASGSVELAWQPVAGAAGYRVLRTDVQLQEYRRPLTAECIPRTSHVDQGLGPRRYTYDVSACPAGIEATVAVTLEARATAVRRAYTDGAAAHGYSGGVAERDLWERAALATTREYPQLLEAWAAIGYTALMYEHTLRRAPTASEVEGRIAQLAGGRDWRQLWREVATSAERDNRFGHFAPAPMSPREARELYGLPYERAGESCFGGLGMQCDGGVPDFYPDVQPKWIREFTLPDGTRMGYVETGVAVGSILHDNACVDAPPGEGIACNGWTLPEDWLKHMVHPAAAEWNKAVWNVADRKYWRAVFGPYPKDPDKRASWYDDLRKAPARSAEMAFVINMVSTPITVVKYAGNERKMTRQLSAPPGTQLDLSDAALCRSHSFSRTVTTPRVGDLRVYGVCR